MTDDLISRQAALNIRFSDAINEDGVLYVPLRDFTDGLKALPSAEPKKGNEKCSNKLPCGWCSLFDAPCSWLVEGGKQYERSNKQTGGD